MEGKPGQTHGSGMAASTGQWGWKSSGTLLLGSDGAFSFALGDGCHPRAREHAYRLQPVPSPRRAHPGGVRGWRGTRFVPRPKFSTRMFPRPPHPPLPPPCAPKFPRASEGWHASLPAVRCAGRNRLLADSWPGRSELHRKIGFVGCLGLRASLHPWHAFLMALIPE